MEVRPQSSVTVQVRVIVSVLPHPATDASLEVIATLPQISLPVAVPFAAMLVSAGHSKVTSGGQLMNGGIVSTTVMICSQLTARPHSSVAVHVRVIDSVFPHPAMDTSLEVIVTLPQISLAVAILFAAMLVSAGHSSVTSG